MFLYQKSNQYFAQAAGGMEALAAAELAELGAQKVTTVYRGIYFEADKKALYRINYCARLLSRVLAPLFQFKCHSTKYLYEKAASFTWDSLFQPENTFAIFANVSNSSITHSRYAAQCLKDAIVDYFKAAYHKRPNVDTENPDVWLNLHIENNRALISLDTSGGSLHKRGYRRKSVEAPMQETLAAAIIRFSEWTGDQPLYDPMCGSGTLLSEALMDYCRMPANILRRRFGFERLPDVDPEIWKTVKTEAEGKIRELPEGLIAGSDASFKAVAASKTNLASLKFGNKVRLKKLSYKEIGSLENTVIISNPPYGVRMGQKEQVGNLYKSFGDFLKQRCQGSTAYLYLGDRKLVGNIGLKPAWKKPLVNGPLEGRLCKFEIY